MRILFTYGAVGRGGDAVQVLALAGAARSRGHDVVISGGAVLAPYAFDTAAGRVRSRIRRLPWWVRDAVETGLDLRAARHAVRMTRRQGVDVSVHWGSTYDIGAVFLARHLRAPLILYLDRHVEAERGFRGEGYWRALHARRMKAAGRAAAVIAVPSRAVADYYTGLGLPQERIEIVPNGVSERHLRLGLAEAGTHPSLSDATRCTLGFVGSLSPWHRVDVLLDALRLLRDHRPQDRRVRLVTVGRGSEEAALRARAHTLSLDELVEWRGALSHDDAVRAMLEFDIAVLPSTLPTGAPMKLSEYAALARPIIAPDQANIRDLFADREEIVLVPPGNPESLAQAIRSLAADPARARGIGQAAQRRVAERTWERAIDVLLRRAFAGEPAARS
jgi:glycosyltransferase involved in cell wall biosynthesis